MVARGTECKKLFLRGSVVNYSNVLLGRDGFTPGDDRISWKIQRGDVRCWIIHSCRVVEIGIQGDRVLYAFLIGSRWLIWKLHSSLRRPISGWIFRTEILGDYFWFFFHSSKIQKYQDDKYENSITKQGIINWYSFLVNGEENQTSMKQVVLLISNIILKSILIMKLKSMFVCTR